jgi:tetratricopeptide (TPR) repeat protein
VCDCRAQARQDKGKSKKQNEKQEDRCNQGESPVARASFFVSCLFNRPFRLFKTLASEISYEPVNQIRLVGGGTMVRSRIAILLAGSFLIPLCSLFAFAQEKGFAAYQETVHQAEAKMLAQEWSEAAALWEQVTAMNPHLGSNWKQLALSRLRAKDYRKAITAYEKMIDLGVEYPFNAAYAIARCYALMGEKEAALRWIERSLDMGLRNLKGLQDEQDFASLRDDERFRRLAALTDTSKMTRDEGWRYDLWLLARELKRIHYDLFSKIPKQDFEAYVAKLNGDVPRLSDHQIEVGFMKLMRMAGDGHTRILPTYARPEGRRAALVQFYLFTEGLYVTAADPKYSEMVGAQVLQFGERTIEQVIESLEQIISRDNTIWIKFIAPALMAYPQILNGLGLIPSSEALPLTIKDAAGKVRQVSLPVETGMANDSWVTARKDAPKPDPLYLKNRAAPYWFEYLADGKTVYFQYNGVRNDPKEPLNKFCERLFKFINDNAVERLVIDMRWNSGGNNFLNQPLISGLMRCDKINQKGKLFVIVGRNTFSAAMCGAAQIERYTNAIFAGEPTGSSPNFVGETIAVNLPYSKMAGSISDLYWQNSVAMDYRVWIAPQIYAPPSFALFRTNRDPAMEAIMAYRE